MKPSHSMLPRQVDAAKFMLSRPAGGLFWKPGLGKTYPTIFTADRLMQEGEVSSCLVIAPIRVATSVWPQEIEKWAPHRSCAVLHGPRKSDRAWEEHDFYTVNPEGFAWLCREWGPGDWPDMLVVDESTKFKNWTSQRTKLLRKHLGNFARRYILTGTPISNGYMDLFAQIFLLDHGEALGRWIGDYRKNFFYQPAPFQWAMFPGAEEQIQDLIAHLVHYVSQDEIDELPDLVTTRVTVELPPKARKIYDTIERDFFVELDEGLVDAANSGVKVGKLRQAASGAVYSDSFVNDRFAMVHEQKILALDDLIEEIDGPVIVVYEWQHELERVQRYLDQEVPFLSGKSEKQTNQIIKDWNAGDIPVLMLHPASAGHGLNMQEGGDSIIWLNPTWDLEYREQTIGRLRRKGQKSARVFCYEIEAENTVDQLVRYSANAKHTKQQQLFEKLQKYKREKRKTTRR